MASLPVLTSLFFGLSAASPTGQPAGMTAATAIAASDDLSGIALARRSIRMSTTRSIRPAGRGSVTRRGGAPTNRTSIRIRKHRYRRHFRPRSFLRNRARFRFRLRGEGPPLPAGMVDIHA